MSEPTGLLPAREVLRLAAPAPPVLAAEPLYLLVDTAVVGRLGAVPLAGLAVDLGGEGGVRVQGPGFRNSVATSGDA